MAKEKVKASESESQTSYAPTTAAEKIAALWKGLPCWGEFEGDLRDLQTHKRKIHRAKVKFEKGRFIATGRSPVAETCNCNHEAMLIGDAMWTLKCKGAKIAIGYFRDRGWSPHDQKITRRKALAKHARAFALMVRDSTR